MLTLKGIEKEILKFYDCPEDCPKKCREDPESTYPFFQDIGDENCICLHNCPVGVEFCYDYFTFSINFLQNGKPDKEGLQNIMLENIKSNLIFQRDAELWSPDKKRGVVNGYPKTGLVLFLAQLRRVKPESIIRMREAAKELHNKVIKESQEKGIDVFEDIDKIIENTRKKHDKNYKNMN